MARHQRVEHPDAFASHNDFNEQLYLALKQSPWWMISIAIHVLVFFILTLFDTTEPDTGPQKKIMVSQQAETVEEDLEETEEETEEVHEQEIVAEEPVIKDEEISDHVETDNDLPYEESFGQSEGLSDAPFEGPANNGTIGIGGGAGGAFKGRGGGRDLGTGGGGRKKFDDAVEDALRWLAAHQSPNGGWEAAGFNRWCDGKPVSDASKMPDGLGKALYDPGVSGLALCAFLGAGYTNRGKHPFAKVVSKGLRYLKNIQDPEGCFGPRSTQQYIYNHATASLAMVEAYGMTGQPDLQGLRAARAGLHRPDAQPVLRVALRHQARRQRHVRHRLDDDGAQERAADQQGRGQARQAGAADGRRVGVRRHQGLAREGHRHGLRSRRLPDPRHGPGPPAGAGRPLPPARSRSP